MANVSLFSKEARGILTSNSLKTDLYLTSRDHHGPGPPSEGEEELETREVSLPYLGLGAGEASHPTTRDQASCLSCHVTFISREEQVEHYQLDWHRYNIKLRLKGRGHLNQEEFEKISAGDLSSISGSESDSSSNHTLSDDGGDDAMHTRPQETNTRSPFLYFNVGGVSPTHSIFRCIVTDSHSLNQQQLLPLLRKLSDPQIWIILMRAGGHFAGAVFRGSEVLAHKTFHRYTVRAKRGTAQVTRDTQQGGHQPKSAGASLRRYNEAALVQEIRGLIDSWSLYVGEASCIFIRTPKYSRGLFIGDKNSKALFSRSDGRLRSLPFPTRRPTFKEVKNTHQRLATIYRRREREGGGGGKKSGQRSPYARKKGEELKENVGVVRDRPLQASNEGILKDDGDCGDYGGGDRGGGGSDCGVRGGGVVAGGGDGGGNDSDSGNSDGGGGGVVMPTKESGKKAKKKKGANVQGERDFDGPQFIFQLLMEFTSDGGHVSINDGHHVTLLESVGLVPIDDTESVRDQNHKVSLRHLNSTWNGDTLLHTAASRGLAKLIPILMLYGANPSIKNRSGHTPYSVSPNKEVRDTFRRFMAHYPKAYDYDSAHVPSPLTEDMERERNRKEAERKREKKKARKQREKINKEVQASEETRLKAVASLSEREKRAMAAEKRMIASGQLTSIPPLRISRCDGCDQSLVGVVPFERLNFKYCSMDCLKQHRKQLLQQ